MSTTVDNRVVEMRFDNNQFEANVATSMSTLDKLKQKLNLSGASKGLEGLNAAAKNVNMNGLAAGVDTVTARFSALQVMGVTALANITNSAVNAGKRMVSALTVDPIKTGFQEYETQIGAIQTILANTQKEGTNVERVNAALDELNTYADKTIYNFTEMTKNIGTFTAAGVKLDTSVNAIKGIANLAAISGSTSQQASTAMYQLSQALAAGKVSLMDWNSVVNAGMGGQVFQDALVRTSEHLKTGAKEAINTYGSFRESLTKGEWLTTEVLTETLKQISGAYSKAELMAQGYTETQADEIIKLAETAEAAATEVKTLTQLWDTLKEAAQSGWGQTWRIIVGDFEEAKELFTGLSNFLGGFINKSSENRNKILEGALSGNPFSKLAERIEKVTGATEKMTEVTKNYGEIANKVIGGDFGNGQARIEALTKAGYDWAHVQNLINEKLDDSTRHTTNYKESQDKLSKTQTRTIEDLVKMSDAQLEHLGFTKSEIEAFRELEEQSKKTGIPINKLIKDLDQLNGRTLLISSFKNAGQGLVAIITSIGDAWRQAFYGDASEKDILAQKTERLYNMIATIHKFSTHLKVSDETAAKLTRTFKGLFAIVDIITTIAGGGFKLAFKVLSKVLSAFDMDVLDLTANLGDAIVKFRDFLFDNEIVNKGFELLAKGIEKAAEAIKKLYEAFMDLPQVQRAIERIREVFENIKDVDLSEVGQNIIDGLKKGLENGISSVPGILLEIGRKIIDTIKGVLGIHSPSTVMFEIGTNVVEGLVNGLQNGISKIREVLKTITDTIKGVLSNIPWDKLFAAGVTISLVWIVKQIADAIRGIASVFEGFGNLFESFSKVLNGISWDFKAKAIMKFAISLGILTVALIALSKISIPDLTKAVVTIGILSGILIGLAFAMDQMSQASVKIGKNGASIDGLKGGLIQIGLAILMIAAAVKLVGSMKPEEAKQGFIGLTGLVLAIAGVFAAFGVLAHFGETGDINKAGSMLVKMSIAMLLMVAVCKLAAKLEPEEMKKGVAFAGAFVVFVTILSLVSKLAGDNADKIGGMVIKLSIAMLLLVGVCKLIGGLNKNDMKKGAAFATGFAVFVAALVLISKLFPQAAIQKISGLVLSITVSLILMVGVCKLVNKLEPSEALKGAAFVTAFMVMVRVLVEITTIGNDEQIAKVATTILAMSIAIAILAAVAIALSLIDLGGLAKGVTAVGLLGGIMTAMIMATRGANDVKGNIITMSIAIAVMASAVVALSFIDPSKLAGATAALSILMGMFALMSKSAGAINTGIASLASIAVMTVAVGMLGGLIYLLASLPIESTLSASTSLSMLLLSLSASMAIMSKAGIVAPTALISVGIMTLVVAGLAVIIGVLAKCNVGSTLEIATSLSTLLLALSAVCVILSVVGMTGPAAYVGIGALVTLIASVGGLMLAIGALTTYFPKMEEFLNKGIPILEKIGYGLGAFFGNIVGGFSAGLTSGLPEIATNLKIFMDNLQGFVDGAKGINEESLIGVKNLTQMFALLAGANILESISKWITGSSSMETFSTNLNSFGDAIIGFSNKVSGNINEESILAAANAGKLLAEMQSMVSGTGGAVQWFTGEKDLAAFGTQLAAFGDAIVGFSNKVSGGINEEAVTAAANAGRVMAEMQASLVGTGGVIQWFSGEKDMATFGTQLIAFGDAIIGFSNKVSAGINEEAITAAANAGTLMTTLQSKVVPNGGVINFFTGEKDLATFGSQIKAFGSAIVDFSNKVSGNVNEEAVTAAANAGRVMATLQKSIPSDKWFDGKVQIDDFGKKIKKFGEHIADYSKKVAEIDAGSVSSSLTAAKQLVSIAKSVTGVKMDDVGKFKDVKKIGEAIKGYSDKIQGVSIGSISNSASAVKKLASTINSLSGINTSGVSSFKNAVNSLAKTNVSGFVKAFSGSTSKLSSAGANMMNAVVKGIKSKQTQLTSVANSLVNVFTKAFTSKANVFKTTGAKLMTLFASGISSMKTKVSSASASAISSSVSRLRSYYGSFYSAGSYVASGFAAGIRSKISSAAAAAASMAAAAINAAKANLKINSPSKVFKKIGAGIPEGFVMGIGMYGSIVKKSTMDMTNLAVNGANKAMDMVSSILDSDIDMQPTIRPVVDLDDVENSVGVIDRLFGNNPYIGATADVGRISSMMNRYGQNGNNDDIIYAINKLSKKLDNVGGNSYSIGNVTYDDGSNITELVKAIITQARIERRS